MRPRSISLFLKPEPPNDEQLVADLFVDRADELRQAAEEIDDLINGGAGQVLAVVGQARVGKATCCGAWSSR